MDAAPVFVQAGPRQAGWAAATTICHCCRESDGGRCVMEHPAEEASTPVLFKPLPAGRVGKLSWWPQCIGVLGHPRPEPSLPRPRSSLLGLPSRYLNPATHTPLLSENGALTRPVASTTSAEGSALQRFKVPNSNHCLGAQHPALGWPSLFHRWEN